MAQQGAAPSPGTGTWSGTPQFHQHCGQQTPQHGQFSQQHQVGATSSSTRQGSTQEEDWAAKARAWAAKSAQDFSSSSMDPTTQQRNVNLSATDIDQTQVVHSDSSYGQHTSNAAPGNQIMESPSLAAGVSVSYLPQEQRIIATQSMYIPDYQQQTIPPQYGVPVHVDASERPWPVPLISFSVPSTTGLASSQQPYVHMPSHMFPMPSGPSGFRMYGFPGIPAPAPLGCVPFCSDGNGNMINHPERPKKTAVPSWLKEELKKKVVAVSGCMKNTADVASQLKPVEVEAEVQMQPSNEITRSQAKGENGDDASQNKNQQIKRVLTEVLLKVTDELFNEVAKEVLEEEEQRKRKERERERERESEREREIERERERERDVDGSPLPPAAPAPCAPARVLGEGSNDVLGLASYASDSDGDDSGGGDDGGERGGGDDDDERVKDEARRSSKENKEKVMKKERHKQQHKRRERGKEREREREWGRERERERERDRERGRRRSPSSLSSSSPERHRKKLRRRSSSPRRAHSHKSRR